MKHKFNRCIQLYHSYLLVTASSNLPNISVSKINIYTYRASVCFLLLLSCPGWPRTHYMAQEGLKLPGILLPQPHKRCNCRIHHHVELIHIYAFYREDRRLLWQRVKKNLLKQTFNIVKRKRSMRKKNPPLNQIKEYGHSRASHLTQDLWNHHSQDLHWLVVPSESLSKLCPQPERHFPTQPSHLGRGQAMLKMLP